MTTRVRKAVGRLPVRITKIFPPRRSPAPPAPKYELVDKGGRPQPPTVIDTISPTGMHGLRAALGLRALSAEDTAKAAKEASERLYKAARATNAGAEGRPIDPIPAAARPARPATAVPSAQERTIPQGNPIGSEVTPVHNSQMFTYLHREWQAAGRRPLTIDLSEAARLLGITFDQAAGALDALWLAGQVGREPGRAGSLPRFYPCL